METASKSNVNTSGSPRPARSLWRWFLAGFSLVFLASLLLVRIIALHPSGQYAVQYPLWQYYQVMLPRLFASSSLGPATDGASSLAVTAGQHILASTAAGLLAVAVGGWLHRRRGDVNVKR